MYIINRLIIISKITVKFINITIVTTKRANVLYRENCVSFLSVFISTNKVTTPEMIAATASTTLIPIFSPQISHFITIASFRFSSRRKGTKNKYAPENTVVRSLKLDFASNKSAIILRKTVKRKIQTSVVTVLTNR